MVQMPQELFLLLKKNLTANTSAEGMSEKQAPLC